MEFKRYFLGICIGILIFILAFTFRYIGTFTLLKVLYSLLVLTFIYFVIKVASDALSLHFEKRMFYRTTNNLKVCEGDHCKKVFKFEDIFFGRILLVCLFVFSYVLLNQNIVNLGVFFHEIGHLIIALGFNLQILEVAILAKDGYVKYSGFVTFGQRNLLIISGSMLLVFTGMTFLIMLYRNKKMPLTLKGSLSIIIWIELQNDLYYWFIGSIRGIGDPYNLINNSSRLSPFLVAYSSFIFLISLSIIVFFSLGYKMYSQFRLILDEFIPDATIFDIQKERSFLAFEDHYEE